MRALRRWLRLPSVLAGTVLAASLAVMTAVWAVDSIDIFELDGDASQAGGSLVDDWSLLHGQCPDGSETMPGDICPPGNSYVFTGILNDADSNASPDVSVFWQGGSKDTLDIPNWAYKAGSVPDKDQITNAYAAAYSNTASLGIHQPGDLIVTFGLDRFANKGDAFAGFWFFQDNVGIVSPGSGFSGQHVAKTLTSPGDILVLVEFPQGANEEPAMKIYEWDPNDVDGDGNVAPNLDLMYYANGFPVICEPGNTDHNKPACAIANDSNETAPWDYQPKSGSAGSFPFESFYEGAVNISALLRQNGLDMVPCFKSFLAETRASRSETSQLKDFVGGPLPLCQAAVTTEIHDSNDPNHGSTPTDIQDSVQKTGLVFHDKAIVTPNALPGIPDITGSVTFTLYDNDSCDGNIVEGWPVTVDLSGGNGVFTAESPDFDSYGRPGDYSFGVTYNGDSNFPATEEHCEKLYIEKWDSKTLTEIHQKGLHEVNLDGKAAFAGSEIHDFAQVSELNDTVGAPMPTGQVKFHFYSDGVCGTEVIDATWPFVTSLDQAGQAETPDLTSAAGALSFKARYLGDANYNGSVESGCETLTVHKRDASIFTNIHNPAHQDITNSVQKVGIEIHDKAFVSGDGPTPTGTVTFTLYDNLTCDGQTLGSETVYLNAGEAETTPFKPAVGMLSFSAAYSGDDIYNPAGPAECEPLTIEKWDSKTVTEIHEKGDHSVNLDGGAVFIGTQIHDFARVSELNDNSYAPTPTGKVTFHLFADGTCSSEITGLVDGTSYPFSTYLSGGTAETPDLTTQLGALSFRAVYSGDAHFNGSEESGCETLTVNKFDPSVRTEIHDPNHTDITFGTVKVGTQIHDKVFVTGDGPTPTGSVTFTLYDNLTCDGNIMATEPVALSGGMAETTPFKPAAGPLSFSAAYSGDSNYNPGLAVECEPLTVEKFDSKTVTEIHEMGNHLVNLDGGAVFVGTRIHDFARVSELNDDSYAPLPTGKVTFHFFNDGSCTNEQIGEVDGTLYPYSVDLGGGTAETPDLTTLAGALSFRAVYEGDQHFNGSAESGCETLTVNKFDAAIRTEVHDPNHSDITFGEINIGIPIHDKAFVTPLNGGPALTGMVAFTLYDNLTCDGNVIGSEQVALVDGMAETSPFHLAAGPWSFSASYGGDDNYNAAGPAECEPFTVIERLAGCTPGFWKNSVGSWQLYRPDDKVMDLFNVPAEYMSGRRALSSEDSLHDALNYRGGSGLDGAANILLRAAVAALLNASHVDVGYAFGTATIITEVNAALASLDRSQLLSLAGELDAANNEGCPLANDNAFLSKEELATQPGKSNGNNGKAKGKNK